MTILSAALTELGRSTSQLRQATNHADRTTSTRDPISIEAAEAHRAATYVWLAAALEVFVQRFVDTVGAELNGRTLTLEQIKPSILALVYAPDFDSLRVIAGMKMWNRRVTVMDGVMRTTSLNLIPGTRPLDGRTIRPHHLTTIWSVFSLPGSPFPSPAHTLSLTELAATRNDLAHGHRDPIVFGRSKTAMDVLRSIDYVDDIAVEIASAVDDYFANSMFMR